MMSKKNYERAAELVRNADFSYDYRSGVIDLLVDFFKEDNPQFDELRFRHRARGGE